MKLGIIGAMKIEVDTIIAAMANPTAETVGGITYTRGTIGKTEVVAAVCGVGKVFAAMCAQTMIIRYTPDAVINTGVGGSLTRDLAIGDVAVSDAVVQYDMDTSAVGDPVGLISGLNMVTLPADPALADAVTTALTQAGVRCKRGTIATGDRFVADRAAKNLITQRFPTAISCEMEGGAIGQVCTVNHTPFCIVRAISDNADSGACTDFPTFAAQAAKHSASAVIALARGLQ